MCQYIVNQTEWQSFVPDEYVLLAHQIIGTGDEFENFGLYIVAKMVSEYSGFLSPIFIE